MEEKINGKTHTVIDASQMSDIGMKVPVTFTVNGEKFISLLDGRIVPEYTHKVEDK